MKPQIPTELLPADLKAEDFYNYTPEQVEELLMMIFEDVLQIQYKGSVGGNYSFEVIPLHRELDTDSEALRYLEMLEDEGILSTNYHDGKFGITFMKKDLEKMAGITLNEEVKKLEKLTGKKIMFENEQEFDIEKLADKVSDWLDITNKDKLKYYKTGSYTEDVLDYIKENDIYLNEVKLDELLDKLISWGYDCQKELREGQGLNEEVSKDDLERLVLDRKKSIYKKSPAMSSDVALKKAIRQIAKEEKVKLVDMPKFTFSNTIEENKDYTASYPNPDKNSQSYVMLSLALGQAKFHEPGVNTLARLPETDEDAMVAAGVKVMENKMTPEAYVTKLFSVLTKIVGKENLAVLGKDKGQEAFMRDQIELRVKGNKTSVTNVNLKEDYTLKKHFAKQIDKNVTPEEKLAFAAFFDNTDKEVFLAPDKDSDQEHSSRVYYKDEYGVYKATARNVRTYVYITPEREIDFNKGRTR